MPYGLHTHFLTVDARVIHKIDTGNPVDLYSMWTGKLSPRLVYRYVLTSQSSLDAQTL